MDQPTVSTAADFKMAHEAAHQAKRLGGSLPLTLPSGLVILAYRPEPEWWLRNMGKLPQTMAARLLGTTSNNSERSPEDTVRMAKLAMDIIAEVVVSPAVKLDPSADEIHPSLISDTDLDFIMQFAGGEIAASGQGLDTFSGEPGSGTGTGAGSGTVEMQAQPLH